MTKNKFVSIFFLINSILNIEAKVAKPLIFGGKLIPITEAPYLAPYFSNGEFICSANIVNQRSLLTAAHCYHPEKKAYIKVGTDTLIGGQLYNIKRTIVHPKYVYYGHDYDIAVLKLYDNIQFNHRVQPIRLGPSGVSLAPGTMLVTMGFGETEESRHSEHLLKVDIPYVSQRLCAYRYYLKYPELDITDRMICAGGKPGYDACRGDSGGPLVYQGLLVGLVSFGPDKCGGDTPGVYARVSALRKFIDAALI